MSVAAHRETGQQEDAQKEIAQEGGTQQDEAWGAPATRLGLGMARRGTGLMGPLRLELGKLVGQTRLLVVGWLVVLAPVVLVAAFAVQGGTPSDTLFGRWVHASGLAIPLVVMGFAGQWVYPVLASVVGGDIFAAEDRSGTWRLLHTRSAGRLALFVAKSLVGLVVPVLASVALMGSSLAAGLLLVGGPAARLCYNGSDSTIYTRPRAAAFAAGPPSAGKGADHVF
jgi:hypothetical protein